MSRRRSLTGSLSISSLRSALIPPILIQPTRRRNHTGINDPGAEPPRRAARPATLPRSRHGADWSAPAPSCTAPTRATERVEQRPPNWPYLARRSK
jgi:hypothetical protein